MGALEERLGRNIEELRGVAEKVTTEVREEQAQRMRRLERRLAKVEAGRGVQDSSKDRETADEDGVEPSWRPFRDVVTAEPEQGYGDATPLIVEWRRAQ